MKKCPICDQIYQDSDLFCAHDGSTLTVEAKLPQTPPKISNSERSLDSSKWLFLVIGILGTALVGMTAYLFVAGNDKTEIKVESKTNETLPDANDGQKSTAVMPGQDKLPSVNGSNRSADSIANPANANSASESTRPATSPSGDWSGDWSSPSGALLRQRVYLSDDGNGNINGRIEWTLIKTTRPEKMNKIGLSATEYVSGKYNPENQTVTLQGYRKDDPSGVLVMLDSYRLKLSGNNLSGFARNGGKWNGRMTLSR